MELSAQIEIAILSGWKLGEIDRVVGRNETWYASLDRSVKQNRLRFHDHIPQPLQCGHHAGRTRACRRHFESAAPVDAGSCHAEVLQSVMLVAGGAVANQRSYAGAPFDQGCHDAAAEIAGCSRHDDGGVIHDFDVRERTALMQSGDNTTSALALRGVQAWVQFGLERGNSVLEVNRVVVFACASRGAQSLRHRDLSGASWSESLL